MLLKNIIFCKSSEILRLVPHVSVSVLSVARLKLSSLCFLSFNGDIFSKKIHFHCKSLTHVSNNFGNQEKKILEPFSVLQQQSRRYAMRLELSEYGIIWRRPEHIPSWTSKKSGDLLPFEDIDKTQPVVALLNVADDIATADEKTRRLLSLEFSSEKEVLTMARYRMKRKIQRHKYDENSPEVKIALMTVSIRYFQKVLSEKKKNVRLRVRVQELIDKRNSKLRKLRKLDYKRFEWLLEELAIIYKPFPRDALKITRKGSLRTLVDLHCKMTKEQKLEKYRMELETFKKPFLDEKRQTLKWIAETEKKLGLPISVEVPEEEEPKLIESSDKRNSPKV